MQDLLSLPGFKLIEPPQENETDMLFKVELSSPPSYCPKCGCVSNFYGHGTKEQIIMDMPIRAKRVGIKVFRKRYKCRDCDKTHLELMPDVDENHNMTKRLVNYIEREALIKTFLDVAEMTGVTEGTVRNIFNAYKDRKEKEHVFVTPKWLGIDEIYVIKKPRLIMTNIDKRTVYDMVDNRKQDNVIKRLEAIPDRSKIECVTMDMWSPYRRSVAKCMPNAEVVVDKFHVVRMANNALETIRKKVRKNVSSAERKALMHDRKILLKRNKDLDFHGQILLEVWLSKFPELRIAYNLKESFYGIWECSTKGDAIETYRLWLEKLAVAPENIQNAYSDIKTAFTNWSNEIFNHFDNGLTNAYTESLNNIIRKLDQSGRGYSFDVLRAKLLYNDSLHQKRKARFNKNAFDRGFLPTEDMFIEIEFNYGVDFSKLLEYLEQEG